MNVLLALLPLLMSQMRASAALLASQASQGDPHSVSGAAAGLGDTAAAAGSARAYASAALLALEHAPGDVGDGAGGASAPSLTRVTSTDNLLRRAPRAPVEEEDAAMEFGQLAVVLTSGLFGEQAFVDECRRSATCVAKSAVDLVSIPGDVFLHVRSLNHVAQHAQYTLTELTDMLQTFALFQSAGVGRASLSRLAYACGRERVLRGKIVCSQGSEATHVRLVLQVAFANACTSRSRRAVWQGCVMVRQAVLLRTSLRREDDG